MPPCLHENKQKQPTVQAVLTFDNNNIECAASAVARSIGEGVRHLSGSNGEELSWAGGPGRQLSGAAIVCGGWLYPADGCAAYSAVYGGGDIVDAGDGRWNGID